MRTLLKYILILSALIYLSDDDVFAQFTIVPKPTTDIKLPASVNSTLESPLDKKYYDKAAQRAERRKLFKERNTIEFSASAETSLQQYENWSGNANNTFYILSSMFFNHQYKRDKLSAGYRIEANFGMNYIEGKSFKNKDEFKINAQAGWQAHEKSDWSYSATTNFRSQFANGYKSRDDKTLTSTILSPGYWDIAVGFKYAKEKTPFKVNISPLGGNAIIVLSDDVLKANIEAGKDRYGVPHGKSSKWRLGPSVDIFYDKTYGKSERYRYRSNLYLFAPYNNFGDPMFRWENTVEIRISKYISTKLYYQMYYLKEANHAMQYQYSFLIGLKYTFKNKNK